MKEHMLTLFSINFVPGSRSCPSSALYILVPSFINRSLLFNTGPGSDCMFLVPIYFYRNDAGMGAFTPFLYDV